MPRLWSACFVYGYLPSRVVILAALLWVAICLGGCSDHRQPPPTVIIDVLEHGYAIDHRHLSSSELVDYLTELADQSRHHTTGSSRWRVRVRGSSASAQARRAGEAAMAAGFPQVYYQP